MTWWGALGLALALYGVVVLLEWMYGYIVRSHAYALTPISLVVRVTNQEAHIEHALRDLAQIFSQRPWENRAFEVVVSDSGSEDKTPDIVERIRAQYPYFHMANPGASDGDILRDCQYPIVIWLDFTRHSDGGRMLGTLRRLLSGVSQA